MPRPATATVLRAVVATVAAIVLTTSTAGAAPVPVDTWTYEPSTRQLVAAHGSPPFAVQGGSTVYDEAGAPAVRFTSAPSLAIQTSEPFVQPGAADFAYEAVVAVDWLRARSTPNVFQYGRFDGHQVKLQLSATGVPQCVLNGTGGRIKFAASTGSIHDGGRHTVSCWRVGGQVGITVDGLARTRTFALGSVTPVGRATAGNRASTGKAADQLYGRIWSLSVSLG